MDTIDPKKIRHNEVAKKWRENNREIVRKQALEYVSRQIEQNTDDYRERTRKAALKHYYKNYENVRAKDNERKRLYRLNSNKEYLAEQREYRKNNPDKFKQYYEKRKDKAREYARIRTIEKYGITEEKYNQILLSQKGKCALCEKDFTGQKNIDHCHKSTKVRGILCSYCNTTLGYIERCIEKQPDIFDRITKYLKTQSN